MPDVQKELARFTADAIWVDDHREELLKQYPDQWIAVYNQQVVGSAAEIEELVEQLERDGFPPNHIFTEYLTDEEDILILPTVFP